MKPTFLFVMALTLTAASAQFTQAPSNAPHWSVRNGLTLALYPRAISGDDVGGPRGLIRIGLPLRAGDALPRLLNFIAVEPVTKDGRRGYSELEKSPGDGAPGIQFWIDHVVQGKATLTGPDILRLTIRMEKFANGAHPYLVAVLDAGKPHEVRFEVYAEPDSAPMQQCILTATMGNYQRLRRLHLKQRIVTTDEVLPEDPGENFTRHAVFPLNELERDKEGVFVAAEGTEDDPRELSKALPPGLFWAYGGENFTQYWRQPEPVDSDLQAVVNARKTYWMSQIPLPGGKAFENFELNAAYHPGQVFIFGIKTKHSK
ncbi:MAG: hypothetical protein JO316_14630 [Abitibacteriaceae bacterium]|nr:hypothetical protein [Abditibacteriaceae bacterium]